MIYKDNDFGINYTIKERFLSWAYCPENKLRRIFTDIFGALSVQLFLSF